MLSITFAGRILFWAGCNNSRAAKRLPTCVPRNSVVCLLKGFSDAAASTSQSAPHMHVLVPRLPFESCSNCEVQHSYTPTSLQ